MNETWSAKNEYYKIDKWYSLLTQLDEYKDWIKV